ncbi:MAG TPA: hypothetical protein VE988_09215 [Gemmataceae bacterium]|nr:hypothetical protein [Gemmataceae bacterium]
MVPIEASITDQDAYSKWSEKAGVYASRLSQRRDHASTLLDHEDPVARLSAIESFWHLWSFDEPIARKFFGLATEDCDQLVKYSAGLSLTLMHLRCRNANDKAFLEGMLDEIVSHVPQMPELVEAIVDYLDGMRVGGAVKCKEMA